MFENKYHFWTKTNIELWWVCSFGCFKVKTVYKIVTKTWANMKEDTHKKRLKTKLCSFNTVIKTSMLRVSALRTDGRTYGQR